MTKEISLGKTIFAAVGTVIVVGLAAFGGASLANNNPDDIAQKAADNALEKYNDKLITLEDNVNTTKVDVKTLSDKILEEDMFEAASEALAKIEIADDDYEELADWIQTNHSDLYEKEDINEVIFNDVDVTVNDLDDQDSTVTAELKVYYEDIGGDIIKRYITATVVIKDAEVDSVSFA